MHWKEKLYTVSATIFVAASAITWYCLFEYPQVDPDTLGTAVFFSTVSGGILAASRFFSGRPFESSGRRGLTSGEMAAARFLENERRLDQLEASEARMADLEARLEFTERLLANQDRDRMPQSPPNRNFEIGSRSAYRTPPERTPQP